MDKIDLYDEQKRIIKTYIYDKGYVPKGLYYYTVHVWIYNCKHEFLIQQRSRFVKKLPGLWTITSGTVLHLETPLIAAKREIHEELGIKINIENLKLVYQYRKDQHFVDVFCIKMDVKINELKIQKSEVENIKFVSNTKIQNMVKKGKFYKYIYLFIFDI